MRRPEWATHTARFCGIVPCWYADESSDGCKLQGRGWFADRVLFPVVEWAFALGAELFDWDAWPITLTGTVTPHPPSPTTSDEQEERIGKV